MSDDLLDPGDPEYELKVAEAFQRMVNRRREGDDLPVRMTVRQALKIAAIMGALARGHSTYTDALGDASWFLQCLAVQAHPDMRGGLSRSAADAWSRVDAWPWARPGEPRDNADEKGWRPGSRG